MTTRNSENPIVRALPLLALLSLAMACVEYLPIRNGLRDEQIYLDKAKLTKWDGNVKPYPGVDPDKAPVNPAKEK